MKQQETLPIFVFDSFQPPLHYELESDGKKIHSPHRPTMSELSIRFNSMNQCFWAQNIKIYHKKMPLCQIILLTLSHMPASKHQFFNDIFI